MGIKIQLKNINTHYLQTSYTWYELPNLNISGILLGAATVFGFISERNLVMTWGLIMSFFMPLDQTKSGGVLNQTPWA